jgi:hypothetical protein
MKMKMKVANKSVKQITGKQRAARVRNIAVARKAKKKKAYQNKMKDIPRPVYGYAVASMRARGYSSSQIRAGRR